MTVIIKLLGRSHLPVLDDGPFLKSFDANKPGWDFFTVTWDKAEALKFDNMRDAMETWRTQSTVTPLRWDNKPNRPLTAFHVEFVRDLC